MKTRTLLPPPSLQHIPPLAVYPSQGPPPRYPPEPDLTIPPPYPEHPTPSTNLLATKEICTMPLCTPSLPIN